MTEPLASRIAARFRAFLARQLYLPVVYIPSQTNIGFSVFVPNPHDAQDLTKFLGHSRLLGPGRIRTQKSFLLDAVEVQWVPGNGAPTLREFTHEIEQWARRHGYTLARDMRQLRQGLGELHA